MIITGSKALRIVSNHAVLQKVPELLVPVEAYVKAARTYEAKRNCKTCDRISFFSPVEEAALSAIAALPPDAVARLKEFLGAKDLFVNLNLPGQKAESRELK